MKEVALAYKALTDAARKQEEAHRAFQLSFIDYKMRSKEFLAAIEKYDEAISKMMAMPLIEVNQDTEV